MLLINIMDFEKKKIWRITKFLIFALVITTP